MFRLRNPRISPLSLIGSSGVAEQFLEAQGLSPETAQIRRVVTQELQRRDAADRARLEQARQLLKEVDLRATDQADASEPEKPK